MKKQIEIERKFVIKKPVLYKMQAEKNYGMSEITQIYLQNPMGITHRIRSRKHSEITVYTETKKRRIDAMSSVEEEREITYIEFENLKNQIKEGTSPIIKERHVFEYMGAVVEIDVYPQWKKTAILEVELSSRDEKIELPNFIEIVAEVTGNFAYSNAAMSRSFPKELI